MTLNQILATLGISVVDLVRLGFTGFLIIVIGCIKIPKLEINLWGYLFAHIGKAINGEVITKVDSVQSDVDSLRGDVEDLRDDFETHQNQEEEEKIRNARQRILRFNDEVLLNRKHSKEHFEEILQDIDTYEEYCRTHEAYKNNKAVFAIDTIKKVYATCLEEKDFLEYRPKEEKKSINIE